MTTTNSTLPTSTEMLPGNIPLELIKVAGGVTIPGFRFGPEIPDFYMGKYPVTNVQYAAFLNDYGNDTVKTGDYAGQNMIDEHSWGVQQINDAWQAVEGFEQHPVINVTWYGANEFCDWLSEKTEKNYCLPSEVKWEYAARGGNQSMNFKFAGSNKLKEVGWYNKNSHSETKPVGLKLPNELGIFDMSGNVWEWCADVWHSDSEFENAPQDGRARMEGDDQERRVVRGGSWFFVDYVCRVSLRSYRDAYIRYVVIGFRISRY